MYFPIISVLCIPINIITLKNWIAGEFFCKFYNSITLFTNLVSVLSVLLIAIDRNCAVSDPLRYIKKSSKKRATAFIFLVWLLSMLFVVPVFAGYPKFDHNTCDTVTSSERLFLNPSVVYEAVITFLAFVFPLLCVVFLYYAMYKAAKNNVARDERNSCSSYVSSDVVVNIKSPRSSEESDYSLRRHFYTSEDQDLQNNIRFLKRHRAAVTGFLVVFSFILCWLPYFFLRLYQQFRNVTIDIKMFVQLSTFISSILDPYIYFYRNKSTWSYMKKIVERVIHRKKSLAHLPKTKRGRIANLSKSSDFLFSLNRTKITHHVPEEETQVKMIELREYGKVQLTVLAEIAPENENNSYSAVSLQKKIVHQDSSSSNCSSDAGATVASSESDEVICYQFLKKKYSEESTEDEPN